FPFVRDRQNGPTILLISSLVRVPSEYFALTQLSQAATFCHPRSSPPKPPRRVTHRHKTTEPERQQGGGIVRPRAFAVLRLIISSNFVGCSTGRSAGFAPFRILSIIEAARLYGSD